MLAGPLRGLSLAVPDLERPSYALGMYEPHVVATIRQILQSGETAYDVGAHVGYHTLVMARRVGESGRVLAFEPDARNRRLLEHNLRTNGLSQVSVDGRALAEASGEHLFASYGYSSVGHLFHEGTRADATLTRIEVTCLDALVFGEGQPPPRLVKLDVEGAEGAGLRGAERVLAEVRPALIVEVRPGPVLEDVAATLDRHGYVWRPANPQETDWQQHPRADLICLPAERAPA